VKIEIDFHHPDYSGEDLQASIHEILDSNILCAMATIKEGKTSYIHTAYYCYNQHLTFFMLTDPKSQHCQNLLENDSVALAICDSHQPWTEDQKGLQILGRCERAKGETLVEATKLYLKRFVELREWIKHPGDFVKGALETRPYVIYTHWLKLYDTERFGDDNFIPISY